MFINYMTYAVANARAAYSADEVPVGCVIVRRGKIISNGHNLMKATKNQTNHAEKLAIDTACEVLGSGYLDGCDMYVTLEPCHMCAAAISFVRIRRLYIGAVDEKSGGVYHNSKLYYGEKLHYVPDHYNGFCENECSQLMVDFFRERRGGA